MSCVRSTLPNRPTSVKSKARFSPVVLLFTLSFIATPLKKEVRAASIEHQGLSPAVASYFEQYCYRCHGDKNQKGDRRLDQFPKELTADDDAMLLLEEALDAINRGDMPPMKKNVTQPSEAATKEVIAWVTDYLSRAADAKAPSTTVMRRLNRFEYVNTLRDLLGLHPGFFDLTGDFPADAKEHGFDNIGESLTLSNFQMQRYVEVAEASLEKAIVFDQPQPKKQTWSYSGKDFNGIYEYERAPVTWRLIVKDEYIEIGHGQPSERHPNFINHFVRQGGVPADGWYTIRIRAAAANRTDHGYNHQPFDIYQKRPLKMALWIAPEARLLEKNAADQRHLIKVWDLPDGQPEVFTQRVWLGKGAVPFVSWTNGVSSKGNIRKVAEAHHPEVIRATKTLLDAASLGDPVAKQQAEQLLKNANNPLLSEVYHGPRMRVWGMDIEGPSYEQWPPNSHRLLFGDETDPTKIDIDQSVLRLASRAFRRPVSPAEVAHYGDFIRNQIGQGEPHAKAIKLGLAAILTSPRFLYLDEGNEESELDLSSYELVTRLSYFLWGSTPDLQLSSTANSKPMSNVAINSEIDRMLDHEKAREFVEHFTDTWLRINQLGSMPPDLKTFGEYYDDRLESAMKEETRLFFHDLLERNGSILNLLDSDYTFVNDALATHYGIEGVDGEHFRRVSLEPKHHRGGLLGQASVLTLTANGIETSPVVRGVWVLENILGTPPSPPPADVEPLEPDTRGTTTVREQLDKHRNVAACAECHAKIDPLGFALEFYDPIGTFRKNYPGRGGKGPAIDGAGKLPTGEIFRDETDLKKLLLNRKDQFTKALTEKLLTYATGRPMTFGDRAAIDSIASEVAAKGYGLRDLVVAVIQSETFSRR